MLSRIAESLYWVGRYVERAEDTARILDVHVHHILGDPTVSEETACRVLLGVMGAKPPPGPLDTNRVVDILAFDASDACSIVGAIGAARENARGAREVLSTEMWECLNATWLAMAAQHRHAEEMGPHAFFQYVKERAAMMAGLADSTMASDDGWRFLVLGRSLERVDMTARLLLAAFCDPSGSPDWVTTLRSCSAHEAFLRTYKRGVDSSLVAEFLLLDRLFPRSAFHALGVAERCLAELGPSVGRAGQEDEGRRILGRARNELEFAGVRELLANVPSQLRALQSACAEAGDAVARRFFQQTASVEWKQERMSRL
ncbi:MAG TPA: alpha-E domain-containing protein [Acidimicrobiales bacterium]|nr:alpha-E domain-containing protein [Acidimicrobiales bacterium]